jgi:hypothetical protein
MAPWPQEFELRQVAQLMGKPLVIDTGNHLDRHAAAIAGLEYHGMGR